MAISRRQFISALGGATVAGPLAARAQQPEQMRRIGVLESAAADDPDNQARHAAFVQGLQQLGWTDGRNVRIDTRWAVGNAADARKYAAELVALAPDVILAAGSTAMAALLGATRTVPIVFVIVPDPVGAGYVDSLSRPGGNATGFMMFEYSLCGKWLGLLKEIAPGVTRAAILRDTSIAAGIGQFAIIQSVAPSVGVDVTSIDLRDAAEIERAVTAFARSANGGLILTASALAAVHHDLIITLAARYKLPAVYHERYYVAEGGLISYGPNFSRPIPASDRLRRSHPQRREAGRPAGAGADQVRTGDQSQDRQGARPRHSAGRARPRRRGDRVADQSNHARLLRCTPHFRCGSSSTFQARTSHFRYSPDSYQNAVAQRTSKRANNRSSIAQMPKIRFEKRSPRSKEGFTPEA
jgi:putative tryptophan/tyrosine transport system substrate-binding protein